jgi:N-formylglutamate deformylase
MKKIILHIPHSSTFFPYKDGFVLDEISLENEVLRLTDWYTDDLYDAPNCISIKAEFSRLFCDPERFVDDDLEPMAKLGMGVLYTKTDDGRAMRNCSDTLRKRILEAFYFPHHAKLNKAVNDQLQNSGKALILDCHSFPSTPLLRNPDQSLPRPEINIGSDSFHTSDRLVELSMNFFLDKKYTCKLDSPFTGSIVPMEHYKKNENVQSVLLELNRKLYLEGDSNQKSSQYNRTKTIVQEYIELLKNEL